MISNDEIKCAARRFSKRSCKNRITSHRDWVTGFNMGYRAANRFRGIKSRRELYSLLRILYD